MPNPILVACPDCGASPRQDCTTAYSTVHSSRVRSAELNAVEQGTCDLCGKWLARGTVSGLFRVWHPNPDDAAQCPPLPDPTRDWNGYAFAIQAGVVPGEPGPEHFLPQGTP